ncbi:MAG TPA: PD-(D/E)XK nuclease family protein [Candidatus Limnocylindrales bacterium]|nr:PD-(D/E)XK nuclease family protein [Candidatus Limnocylindrales bacterium]
MPDPIDLNQRPTRSLSPSRALDFQSCPLLYRFRVLDRLPEPPSPAAVRGTLVHSVLEALYDLPADQRTLDEAIGLVGPQWDLLVAERPEVVGMIAEDDTDPLEWLRGAGDLVEAYFAMEDPTRLEPAARELQVQAALPSGLVLRGFVDRLDRAPTGQLRVVDYKTGKPPGVGFEARAMFQMRFYALALWHMHGELPTMLQLMYLSTGVVLRYEPDEEDLRAMQRKVEALWTAIERAMESGDWRARPSALCNWCAHQSLCPEWGGTPPPLPMAGATPAAAAE